MKNSTEFFFLLNLYQPNQLEYWEKLFCCFSQHIDKSYTRVWS